MIYFANFNVNINAYFYLFCYGIQHSNCYSNVKNIDHSITSLNKNPPTPCLFRTLCLLVKRLLVQTTLYSKLYLHAQIVVSYEASKIIDLVSHVLNKKLESSEIELCLVTFLMLQTIKLLI